MELLRLTKTSIFLILSSASSVVGISWWPRLRWPAHAPNRPATTGETFHFLHIGKAAGTTVSSGLHPSVVQHAGQPRIIFHGHRQSIDFVQRRFVDHKPSPADTGKVFFWVRAPVHRFTSGWLSRFREGKPNHHRPWDDFERWAFERFATPDKLACALSSSNETEQGEAKLVFSTLEHLGKPLSRIFHSVETVREMATNNSIAFVGRTEHFVDDWGRMVGVLRSAGAIHEATLPETIHENPDVLEHFKDLSQCAVDNVRTWYAEDYTIIQTLASFGLLTSDYPKEIDSLDTAPDNDEYKRYLAGHSDPQVPV